ncbi:MAG: diguanylate cyclase [Rubrivivax sp.]|nr:diguanylate cyclase [Rubrivivax sp.]
MNGLRHWLARLPLGWLGWAVAVSVCAASPAGQADSEVARIEAQLRGQPEKAVAALDRLLPGTQNVARMDALLLKGFMLIRIGDLAASEEVAQHLDRMAADSKSADGAIASASAGLLRARAVARGGPASRADRQLTEALARLPATAPATIRLRFLDSQAAIKQSLGQLDLAVALYQQSVTLADQAGSAWRRAELRGLLAYAVLRTHQPDRALDIHQEALRLARESGDALAQSSAMTVAFIIYSALGRTEDELRAGEAAIDLARQAGAKRQEVLTIANLADFYLQRQDHATALRLALQALPLAREVNDLSSESVALTNAGLAMIALGRHDEGRALVREALVKEESAGALSQMLAIQEELGHALEKAGLLNEAWQALSEHRRLADDVFQRKHQQAVLELQEGFDAERRQRELAVLQTENRLKEAQLLQRELQQRLWAVGLTAGVLLLVVVGLLLNRMRKSNAQLQNSNTLLKVASERDPLTGLANRRHLLQVMEQSASEGQGFEGSMLLIDIDHFKRVNDQHGHAAGDQVLVETARRLRAALREEDLTVRWGGEEFLVVVRQMPADEVETLAQRLLAAIGREPVLLGRDSIGVTASIGFATFPLQPLRRPLAWERAIDLVDTAMYLAKAHGRNRAYGVRALQEEDGAQATAQPATLESAWRSGRADLAHLSGPAPVQP